MIISINFRFKGVLGPVDISFKDIDNVRFCCQLRRTVWIVYGQSGIVWLTHYFTLVEFSTKLRENTYFLLFHELFYYILQSLLKVHLISEKKITCSLFADIMYCDQILLEMLNLYYVCLTIFSQWNFPVDRIYDGSRIKTNYS